ncbi:MAG TPA: OmpA family protein [Bryobacteraceae bacterium]|jgi:peptidoglycan-associated lipoprotein|nr:OmpA family protein [Bryobacteraceae bacterium]
MKNYRELAVIAIATLSIIGVGCAKKKVAAITPNTPPVREVTTPGTPAANPPQREASTPPASAPSTPRSDMPDAATRARIDQLLAKIEDAYFDYDKHSLRPDAIKALEGDSTELRDILKDYPAYKLTIEGHCDERGSAEYNMVLGEARAEAAKNYLVQVGIPGQQLGVVSYGKEKPVCQDENESCWQKNRRIHIVAVAQQH